MCLIVTVIGAAVTALGAQQRNWPQDFDRGDRYEGVVDLPRSAAPLRVISFLAGKRPALGNSPRIRVRYYAPAPEPIVVSARELVEDTQYRMESKPITTEVGWKEYSWPANEIIRPAGVAINGLGFLVKLPSRDDTLRLLPAWVYDSDVLPAVQTYTMTLRSRYTLKSVTYTLKREAPPRGSPLRTDTLTQTFTGEEAFPLPINVTGLVDEWVRLRIEGEYAFQKGGPLAEFLFFHRARQ